MNAGYHYFDVGDRDLAAGLYLTSVGRGGVAAGERYPAPGHPDDYDFSWSRGRVLTDTALVFIGTGGGEFETRSGSHQWRAGEAVLLPPGLWHRYRPSRDTGWSEYWLTISGELLGRLWQQWENSLPIRPSPLCSPAVFRKDLEHFIASVMRETKQECAAPRSQLLTWTAAGLGLVGRFVEQHLRQTPPRVHCDDAVDRALRLIHNHAHRPLSVRQIADAVGMTRRTLERRFADAVGRPPREELERLRVRRAEKLLLETRRPIKEIAYLCGFREPRGLIRACRRWLGTAPGGIRHRATAPHS